MKPLWGCLCTRLAVMFIAAAALAMPSRMQARYYLEWRAELEECERQGIGPLLPAMRIAATYYSCRFTLSVRLLVLP